jgi:6-phosphogluconolactonase
VKRLVRVFDTPEAASAAAAERIVQSAVAAIARSGTFRLCLSGGRTPEGLYRILASDPSRVDWSRVALFFADERAVPPDAPESNYRLVAEALIDRVGVPPSSVHRMRGEMSDLAAAAAEYETQVSGPMDLLVLGVGEDGHTASIFPGSPLTAERGRRVAFVEDAPKPPPRRLTVTPRVLDEARAVAVLASGQAKARAVARALEQEGSAREVPARLVKDREWFLDRAAAARLEREG